MTVWIQIMVPVQTGLDARCVTDLAVAQMHDIEPRFIRRLIRHNQARFEKSVDIIEFSRCAPEAHLENTLLQLGYTQSMLEQEGLVYILSERGYFKLVKIMNNDRVWDVHK